MAHPGKNEEIKNRTTDELLLIAANVSGDYAAAETRAAATELKSRGVSPQQIAGVTGESDDRFLKRLEAAARAEDRRKEKNRTESYPYWKMAIFFFFAPFYLPAGIGGLFEPFRELKRLKAEKYDLKFAQRLTMLVAGNLMYAAFACGYYL
ncbi:MAG: transcription initiation factor IID [Parabacteroides sp.]|nr:transcription initiation factor IID [Parabacteroides sp.]